MLMRAIHLIILFFIAQSACAINNTMLKDKFQQNVDSINILLSIYDTLDMYNRQEWETHDRDGNVLPGVNPYSIEYMQSEIIDRLTYMLTDKKILHHKITDLIKESNTLFISCSADS